MLKRSRKLRFLKWAGLVGCVLLVGAWVSNLWWNYGVVETVNILSFYGLLLSVGDRSNNESLGLTPRTARRPN